MARRNSLATLAVISGRSHQPGAAVNPGISMSSTFQAGGERRYARSGTETWEAFEQALGTLEGGRAVAFGSGLAAMAAALELAPRTVAASRRLYVGTTGLLEDMARRGRVDVGWFDAPGDTGVATADLVVVEDPTNPALGRIDLDDMRRRAQGLLVVDNTVATPAGRQPLEMGADVVVHSATKSIGGHSDILMGAAVARQEQIVERLFDYRTLHGAVPGSLEAFLALRGLRTLPLRMERITANAAELAGRLAAHAGVSRVTYPGLGCLMALELDTDADGSDAFVDRLELWQHATSLGGVESTLERRARWADESPDVSDRLIRLSVGIEDVEDLWADLARSLSADH